VRSRRFIELKKNIHLDLRVLVMNESKVDLVKPEGFTINFASVGHPVTIRAESDEIIITMRLALRPRDNVMKIDFDVSAGGNGATVASLDEHPPPEVGGYSWAIFHGGAPKEE
jgi:hypothetical protein